MPGKIHILSTAPLDEDLIASLDAARIMVTVCPFIETQPALTPAKQKRIQQLGTLSCVALFTSKVAVETVAACLPRCPEWTFYCIGGATQKTLRYYYPGAQIKAVARYGKDLALQLIQNGTTSAVLFCGNKRLDTIPQLLYEAGIPLEEIQVYETRPVPHRLSQPFDGVLFMSPSAVESFLSVNTLAARVPCFAIGHTTAQALKSRISNPVIVSTDTSREALIQAIIHYFTQQ